LVARLAYQKAADVVGRVEYSFGQASLVVACDTVVQCQGQILGKPYDEHDARQMLRRLSSREHRVYSGLCVWPLGQGEPQVEVAQTTLRMDPLSEEQIEAYLASGKWEGKAGAFGYQDRLGWVHIKQGSESNVVGLPMELLAEMLARIDQR
jgi:septum formation protein